MTKLNRSILVFSVVLVSGLFLNASSASADGFSLGAFDNYGILINNGTANADVNTAPVNANIGVGNITGTLNLHNETVNGEVDFAGGAAGELSGGAITGTQPVSLGGASPSGSPASVNSNVSAVETAISTALSLSSTYGSAAEVAAATAITINGGGTINASSGHTDASGAKVFAASSFSIGNGHTLTINGSASDFVVIDITGNSNDKLDGALALTGGITPDHVLINFIGVGGNVQGAANGATLDGTFLIPTMKVQLNSLSIDGHLFGGAAGQDFQLVSNSFVVQQPEIPSTPEPSTLLMLALGLITMAFLGRSRQLRFNNLSL